MKYFSKNIKLEISLLIISALILSLFSNFTKPSTSLLATSTYYETAWYGLDRDKITTSGSNIGTSYGANVFLTSLTNVSNYTTDLQYAATKEKSTTINIGGSVPIKAVELEAGYSASWSTSETVTVTAYSVLKGGTVKIYKRKYYDNYRYNSYIEHQTLATPGNGTVIWTTTSTETANSTGNKAEDTFLVM